MNYVYHDAGGMTSCEPFERALLPFEGEKPRRTPVKNQVTGQAVVYRCTGVPEMNQVGVFTYTCEPLTRHPFTVRYA